MGHNFKTGTYAVSTRPFAVAAQSLLMCAEKYVDSQGIYVFEQLLFVLCAYWLDY
jgi:hypothetical protein